MNYHRARTRVLLCIWGLAVLGTAIVAFPSAAYGYIDPGTGTFFLQMVLAAFFGVVFFARGIIRRVKHALFGQPPAEIAGDEDAGEPTPPSDPE